MLLVRRGAVCGFAAGFCGVISVRAGLPYSPLICKKNLTGALDRGIISSFQPKVSIQKNVMNTLRQLAARIARQCAVAAACAFNAVCAMQRCCPPPPRNFEIKFALRRIGILAGFAVCILTLAAPDAQAQTSCDEGERAVTGTSGGGQPATDCFSDTIADYGDACAAAKWNLQLLGQGTLFCEIGYRTKNEKDQGLIGTSSCQLTSPIPIGSLCTAVFGDPPQFPTASGNAEDDRNVRFVYNCDPDGESGLIPATINTIGATECVCPSGQGVRANGTCGACSTGQVVQSGVCVDCPAESVARGGVCIPESGDFGLADELLCGAFGGTVQTATGGREVCSGMDANDTFCIIDSADAFPCRGLFKHLRSCNLQFNRKALNPFFCGNKCGAMEAFGSGCR